MDSKIIQWNCRSIIPKKTDLIYLINKYNPTVIALSETWLNPVYLFNIPGYICLREDRFDGYGGVAILIKKSVNFTQINFPSSAYSDIINVIGIKIDNIAILSIYLSRSSRDILNEVSNLFANLARPFLVLGDFNCHHQSWGSEISNSDGIYLLDILHANNLCLLNTGAPTRRTKPNEHKSAVDLSVCTPNLASSFSWSPHPYTYGSDHYPLIISSPIRSPPTYIREPRLKYKLSNADWTNFKQHVESKITELPEIVKGDESNAALALAACLINVADQLFPVKKPPSSMIPFPPWWSTQCSEVVKRRKVAEKEYAKNMSDQNLDILNDVIKSTKLFLREKKQEGWKSFCASLSPTTCPSEVWRSIKRFKTAFSDLSSPRTIPDIVIDDFLDKLAPPYVPEKDLFPSPLSFISSNTNSMDAPFTLYELKGVLSSIRDSSPGEDGIPYSFLSHLGDRALSYYLDIINSILISGNVPSSWKSQEVLPIKKPNKPLHDAASYRPIALSIVLAKIAEYLVKNRLEWYIEHNRFLADSQFGFRKAKCTIDNISIFTTDIRIAFSCNNSTVAAFLDISAAYDNVVITILKNKLLTLKVPLLLVNFIINILSERTITINLNDSTKLSRTLFRGLPQGSVLSPLLYNIYTYDLEKALNGSVSVLQYADDLLLYTSDASLDNACNTLTYSLNLLKSWLNCNGLELSTSKSSVVVFSRRRIPPDIVVKYNNLPLPVATHAKFLGVILDSKLTGAPYYDHIVAKCERMLNIVRCLSGVWWGAHPFSMKLFYNALIRSVLDYGTFLLESGSVMGIKKLDVIQSKALRIITGSMKSSPVNALQVECCDPPLQLRRQFLSDRFLFKSMQFSNHSLHQKLHVLNEYIITSPYWRHKSIPCLVKSYRKFLPIHSHIYRTLTVPLFESDLETLLYDPEIRYDLNVCKHDVGANIHFLSRIHEENWQDRNQIFTDASKSSDKECVGVGIYYVQYKLTEKIKLPPESSVFTGECYAILKAIELILLLKLDKTIIFSDSKSALQTIGKFPFKMKPYYPVVFEIRSKLYECVVKGYSVIFAWVPSHCGITGNERADQLAKEAIQDGDMVPYKNYCHDLAALPRVYLQDSWNSLWSVTSQSKGRYYFNIQSSIPVKPWFFKAKCSKIATSIITRMRLGHVCTPSHLARLGIVDDDLCECGVDVCDLDHIFFSCCRYNRSFFLQSLQSLNVPFPTRISCLVMYPLLYYNLLSSFITCNNIKI